MEIFTPKDAARNAGTKYRSILVAARFARYLNEFPKDRQVQWAENERVMKLTTLSMRKLVSGELNFRELRRRRSEGPSASAPVAGPTRMTPRSRSRARFRWVAGAAYIASFIAGASSTGPVRASSTVVSASSAIPCAIRAIRFAVAGATMRRSGSRASRM